MSNIVADIEVNIEDLNRVLSNIEEASSSSSIEELTIKLEKIAKNNDVPIDDLFDMAETSQLDFDTCSQVMSLSRQIKNLK